MNNEKVYFACFDLPQNVKKELIYIQQQNLKKLELKNYELVEKDDLHLTLNFFGKLNPEDIDIIKKKIKTISKKIPLISIEYQKQDILPDAREGKALCILWKHSDELENIHKKLEKYVKTKSVFKEYIPHTTLIRFPKLDNTFKKNIKSNLKKVALKNIKFIEATIKNKKAVYKTLLEVSLNE